MSTANKQHAFLYMPDISGFTQFVTETEIEHSTHIIQELLEIIIADNHLNMEVIEIEGDAVFFFRFGKSPSVKEIVEQSKSIFEKFHLHLLKYEHQRICQCRTCKTASNLTLKFIIHSGMVSSYHIMDRFKLIGKDIIILHRLLKNKVPSDEYLLLTEPFFGELTDEYLHEKKLSAIEETETFDEALIKYKYIQTKNWLNKLEYQNDNSNKEIPNLIQVINVSKEINAPADKVWNYIIDLSKRSNWIKQIRTINAISGEKINRVGTVHKCILENNNVLLFKANYFENNDDILSITELDSHNGLFARQFTIEKSSPDSCIVHLQFLIKNQLINRTLFSIFKKKRMTRNYMISLEKLKTIFDK